MHLRPDRLRAHAAEAAEMADALARLGPPPLQAAEPVTTAVAAAGRELAEIAAALRGAAASAETADRGAADALGRVWAAR